MLQQPNTSDYALNALSAFAQNSQAFLYILIEPSDLFSLDISQQAIITNSKIVPTLLEMLRSHADDINRWRVGAEGLLILQLL